MDSRSSTQASTAKARTAQYHQPNGGKLTHSSRPATTAAAISGIRSTTARPSRVAVVAVAASAIDDLAAVHGPHTLRRRVVGVERGAARPTPRNEAGAPAVSVPVTPSLSPAARQPPRVAAANAACTETALPGVLWWVAARTLAQGFMLVTGLSEPKARGTPRRC